MLGTPPPRIIANSACLFFSARRSSAVWSSVDMVRQCHAAQARAAIITFVAARMCFGSISAARIFEARHQYLIFCFGALFSSRCGPPLVKLRNLHATRPQFPLARARERSYVSGHLTRERPGGDFAQYLSCIRWSGSCHRPHRPRRHRAGSRKGTERLSKPAAADHSDGRMQRRHHRRSGSWGQLHGAPLPRQFSQETPSQNARNRAAKLERVPVMFNRSHGRACPGLSRPSTPSS